MIKYQTILDKYFNKTGSKYRLSFGKMLRDIWHLPEQEFSDNPLLWKSNLLPSWLNQFMYWEHQAIFNQLQWKLRRTFKNRIVNASNIESFYDNFITLLAEIYPQLINSFILWKQSESGDLYSKSSRRPYQQADTYNNNLNRTATVGTDVNFNINLADMSNIPMQNAVGNTNEATSISQQNDVMSDFLTFMNVETNRGFQKIVEQLDELFLPWLTERPDLWKSSLNPDEFVVIKEWPKYVNLKVTNLTPKDCFKCFSSVTYNEMLGDWERMKQTLIRYNLYAK